MTLPPSYREQAACANCQHVFVRNEFDDGPTYLCTFDAPPRPKSMSMAHEGEGEYVMPIGSPAWRAALRAWHKWSQRRRVIEHFICASHTPRPATATPPQRAESDE